MALSNYWRGGEGAWRVASFYVTRRATAKQEKLQVGSLAREKPERFISQKRLLYQQQSGASEVDKMGGCIKGRSVLSPSSKSRPGVCPILMARHSLAF
ncbi:hypothetical protein CGL51_05870 [Pyrobaculum aerophilum]|uniref:Uncharacterized protein n=2 Tax=Pyrobaculum aerophilum TaxID=13773 RepID=A0A371QZE2_9CREN|nr:hypothetical protein CGL51_05870 [Pyrobaculum aerophilum]RFA98597.1 hypothetical protein CGL52_06660 [Pyrobaculum aerophilum]